MHSFLSVFFSFSRRPSLAAASLCVVLGCSGLVWGQQQRLPYTPSTAIGQASSRAEQEAEQMVSLSADKITQILQDEAGLLLQVKKALVRKAFEQGRILDPNDLTDEALFRLIREDQNVRVIATREIEDRAYIRAKPTREELAKNLPCREPLLVSKDGKLPDEPDPKTLQGRSQEQLYWAKHDSDLDCYLTQYLPGGTARSLYEQQENSASPQSLPASQYPQQTNPQPQSPLQQNPPTQSVPPSSDYRRQLELTQTQSDDYFGMDRDESQMASIQPDQLPSLLSASQTSLPSSRKGTNGGGSDLTGSGTGKALSPSLESSDNSVLGSLMSRQNTEPGFGAQEARLENQRRLQPSYTQPKLPQQPRLRHRPNPYADIPSLYDLYAQYSRQSPKLERFGADVFRNGSGNLDQLPMDLPAGPDYVVGPGDGLTINLSGG